MSAQLRWTLLVIGCIVGLVTGNLHKPVNLKVESRNFSLYLTWLPDPANPPTVTYQVQCKTGYDAATQKGWKSVSTCKNITVPVCDLTCFLMKERYWQHMVRVRAVSHLLHSSPWVKHVNISYMFTVEPDPPSLHLTQGESSVSINFSVLRPTCLPEIFSLSHLKFSVEVTRNNNLIIQDKQNNGSLITIKTHGYQGEYCFAAKTIYSMHAIKESSLSKPVCKFFAQKESYTYQLLVGNAVILFIIGCVLAICYVIWFRTTKKNKMPKVLDFPLKKCHLEASKLSLENEHGVTKYDKLDQVSSAVLVQHSEKGVGEKDYPLSVCSYMQRRTMQDNLHNMHQTGSSSLRDYTSSNGLSNSDKSSSDCNCDNTSGSNTGISVKLDKMQLNDIQQESNIIDSVGIKTLSPTNRHKHHLFTSPCILVLNDLGNVNFDTLCIADNNDQQEISDDDSSKQLLTESEDSLEQLSIDVTDILHSNRTAKDGKPPKKWSSGYEQRNNTTRKF